VLTGEEVVDINRQFTALEPMIELGRNLAACGQCSSCMDNTDGLGQTLCELALSSGVAFFVDAESVIVDGVVRRIAESINMDSRMLAFSAGADLSLVGTLKGAWSQAAVRERLGFVVTVIGQVGDGEGAWFRDRDGAKRIACGGWNYFMPSGAPQP
jgi:thiamine monophosphate kinase